MAILDLHRHGVVPYFTQSQMDFHIFWLNSGIYAGRLLVSLLVGCVVALAAKGREMVAAMTLGFITAGLPWAGYLLWGAKHRGAFPPAFLPFLVNILGGSVLIVVGGGIVRKIRVSRSASLLIT